MVHHAARGCFNNVFDQAHVLPFLIFCLCHGIVHSSAVKKVIWSLLISLVPWESSHLERIRKGRGSLITSRPSPDQCL